VGIGSVLGGIALGVWGGFRRRIVTVILALALDGIAIAVVGWAPAHAFLLAMVATFIVGFLETMVMGLNGAIFQAIVPPEMQGRVFSLLVSVAQVMSPLGLAIAGPVADSLGVQFWWRLAGVVIAAVGVGVFFVPPIMQIEDSGTGPVRPRGGSKPAHRTRQ
jgi:DHA3 family macrolide efflux protein-like MFS transporter